MMPERHRLRGLQMGEARHHRCGVLQRARGERLLQRGQRRVGLVDRVAHTEAEIGRDLVVARARGVQPAGRRADQLGKPALDVHVNVFERALKSNDALASISDKIVSRPLRDIFRITSGDNALRGEHGGVGLGRGDVLGIKVTVEVDRGVDFLHDRIGAPGEPAAPHLVAHDFLLTSCS